MFRSRSPFSIVSRANDHEREEDESMKSDERIEPALRRVSLFVATALAILVTHCASTATKDQSLNGGTSGAGVTLDWCAAEVVLQHKCQRCHRDPPQNGAPFALLTYPDTQVIDNKGKPRFQLMSEAVTSNYMPAQFLKLDPPVEPLTADERSLLLGWLNQGAPLGDGACQ